MPLPGGTVEASRAQRIERHQARYRDRGGRSTSPMRKRPKSQAGVSQHPMLTEKSDLGTADAKRRRSKGPSVARHAEDSENADGHSPIPGPSKPSAPAMTRKRRATLAGKKATSLKPAIVVAADTELPQPLATDSSRPAPARAKKASTKGKASKAAQRAAKDDPPQPTRSAKRKTPIVHPTSPLTADVSSDDEPLTLLSEKARKTSAGTKLSSRDASTSKVVDGLDFSDVKTTARRNKSSQANAKTKAKAAPPDVKSEDPPPLSKKPAKGKRKAEPVDEAEVSEEPCERAHTDGGRVIKRTKRNGKVTKPSTDSIPVSEDEIQPLTHNESGPHKRGFQPEPDEPAHSLSPEPALADRPARKRLKAQKAGTGQQKIAPNDETKGQDHDRRPSTVENVKATRKVSRVKAP
ncbi:hypothetical protein BD311DRAFT_737630 [Dichomitus squalens]|uniref:Uncharacterized protein n=1 Tax=Dichomitus squalens TaxID=114155 RepID=A0A4Q9MUH7_9APHY|nr:hypothetical protein BD311DRAFT_737630 [Dichomitus squalens]